MARKKRKSAANQSEAESPVTKSEVKPIHPPRRRIGLLITSAALLAVWLLYLAFVAWRVTAS